MGGLRVAVAASGGRDSTALLHCTARSAAGLGLEVLALHVHHGLMGGADGWLAQVRTQARRWGAAFDSRRLSGAPAPGDSVEAWARRERYRALAEMARAGGCGLVLLAHHRNDQAETWLLQALRGAGAAGLSAMPRLALRDGITWARPWLDQPRQAIEAYARRHRLRHADDASNADPRYARSRLRLQVWPALTGAFPDAATAIAAAARQAQQARALADEVAALDLPGLRRGDALDRAAWLALPPARRRNALMAWLGERGVTPLPETLLQRLADELPGRTQGRWPAQPGELRLYRGQLRLDADAGTGSPGPPVGDLDLRRPGAHTVPGWRGRLHIEAVAHGGADPALLAGLTAAPRQGGEQLRLAPRGSARSLKKQYQARAVPAWQRDGPLLWLADGRLLFVPGLGIDASLQAMPGTPQLGIRWEAAAATRQPSPSPAPGPRQPGA